MGCLYDIYIGFLAQALLQIYKSFALLQNKNVLECIEICVCCLMKFLIVHFEDHTNTHTKISKGFSPSFDGHDGGRYYNEQTRGMTNC